ncbi:MAG: ABC transporter ATP-binding protein [Bacteroidota bacterium]
MNIPLLQVKNLSIAFADTIAVNNISFNIFPGELVAVVGESGSGKSVTSLSLLQLLPKQTIIKGELLFAKNNTVPVNLLTLDEKSMRSVRGKDIAMIFQEPMTSLNPVFTCGQQVMEAIQLHQKVNAAVAKEKAIELFEKVKLPNPAQIINRYPHEISGGQKQRVIIAMAMSCNPSLLIADEPTTALDVTVQKTILELVKELQQPTGPGGQNGMSVLFVTHDLGLVADIADKVVVMYKGEIVEQGSAIEVLKNPQHNYTKALLQCRPGLHGKGERLPVIGDQLSVISDRVIESSEIKTGLNNAKEPITDHSSLITTLEVQNLKVYYPGKTSFFKKPPEPYKAVDGVSFTVSKGETVGLVGESGCGKTTLGRAILQLIQATSGKIILNGKDLVQLPHKEITPLRKDLQIVFQDPYGSLNPRITIGDAITEPLQVHGMLNGKKERKDKVVELLEKVNLRAEHFNRYPHQFSGGQRQRICIARALALNPSFLIFDESVSALDVSVQAQVLNLLNDLKKEFQFTSIFISHDLSVVHYISDRIIVMQQGKIIEEGLADDIYFLPKQEYTKRLIEAIPGKKLMIG